MTTLMSTHYMDEAERCTRLAYLAYGEMIVTGSVNEVIEVTHLKTWAIKGDITTQLLQDVKKIKGVTQAALFGRQIHVCGFDTKDIEKGLHQLTKAYKISWVEIESTLEDAFISLVEKSEGELG